MPRTALYATNRMLLGGFVRAGGIADGLEILDHFGRYADLLVKDLIGDPLEVHGPERKRLGIDLGIVDRERHLQVIVIDAGVALPNVGVDAVRVSRAGEPGAVA